MFFQAMTRPFSSCALLSGLVVCLCACTAQRAVVDDETPDLVRKKEEWLKRYTKENKTQAAQSRLTDEGLRAKADLAARFLPSTGERMVDGVPQTTSDKKSDFDGKRFDMSEGSPFGGKSFADGGKEAGARKIFDASNKSFGTKQWDGEFVNSEFRHDIRPDFMKEDRGIGRKVWQGGKEEFQRRAADETGLVYETSASDVTTSQRDGIIEEGVRRGESRKIRIVPYRDDQQRSVEDIRAILGRKPGE